MNDLPIPRIGCPVWAHAPWVGRFFTKGARREDYLREYSSVFNTAEGNATFYGIPKEDTVRKWAEEASASFRFCFKFPRAVSHDRQLVGAQTELRDFFGRLAPLGPQLGPFFLQLAPDFGGERLPVLEQFLDVLPAEFRYAVEVRHPDFYGEGETEKRFEAILAARGLDRVIFDTRGLFASAATDPATADARRKKPRVPIRFSATGRHPFVRFVGDPDVEENAAALAAWAPVIQRWREEGKEPFFFTHHPDEAFAPLLGRRLQGLLHELDPRLPAPPAWPCDAEERQLDFF